MKTKSGMKGDENCCDGTVVKVSGNQLTATCGNGDEHHYIVARDARITCDGKKGNLEDLETGSTIRMTMSEDDQNEVLAIDSGNHTPEPTTGYFKGLSDR